MRSGSVKQPVLLALLAFFLFPVGAQGQGKVEGIQGACSTVNLYPDSGQEIQGEVVWCGSSEEKYRWEILVNIRGESRTAVKDAMCEIEGGCLEFLLENVGEGTKYWSVHINRNTQDLEIWKAEELEGRWRVKLEEEKLAIRPTLNQGTDSLWQASLLLPDTLIPRQVTHLSGKKKPAVEWLVERPLGQEELVARLLGQARKEGQWQGPVLLVSSSTEPLREAATGSRVRLGGGVGYSGEFGKVEAFIAPMEPLQPFEPLKLSVNQRFPRVLPEKREEFSYWREESGNFTWLDSRRIDRSLGFLSIVSRPGVPLRGLLTLSEIGRVSSGAFSLGEYGETPISVRLAGISARGNSEVGEEGWEGIVGIAANLGKAEEKHGRLAAEWNMTGKVKKPYRRGEHVRIAYSSPLLGGSTIISYETIGEGFQDGAAFAPVDGISIFQLRHSRQVGNVDSLEVAGVYRNPYNDTSAVASLLNPYDTEAYEVIGVVGGKLSALENFTLRPSVLVKYDMLFGYEFGPSPGVLGELEWRKEGLTLSVNGRVEGTRLYEINAPGKFWAAGAGGVWRKKSKLFQLGGRYEQAFQCGKSVTGASTTGRVEWNDGCEDYGELWAGFGTLGFLWGQGSQLQLTGRWVDDVRYFDGSPESASRVEVEGGVVWLATRGVRVTVTGLCGITGRANCAIASGLSIPLK